jgi:hypothetical protein
MDTEAAKEKTAKGKVEHDQNALLSLNNRKDFDDWSDTWVSSPKGKSAGRKKGEESTTLDLGMEK